VDLSNVTSKQLVVELVKRLDERNKSIREIKRMMKHLEDMNAKLAQSEENKSKFLSLIKNEFNNPISSMINLAKNIIEGSKEENIQSIAGILHEESLRLNFQISNIITAAEIESGSLEHYISLVDIKSLVDETLDSLQFLINEKRIELVLDTNVHRKFYQDKSMIQTVLSNLISNACEFSPFDSKVEVKVTEEEGMVKFEIIDYGEGIDEQEHNDIFSMFNRTNTGKHKPVRGQGLGLSIVKELLDFLEGTYNIRSKVGTGTVFTFALPMKDESQCQAFGDNSEEFFFDDNDMDEF